MSKLINFVAARLRGRFGNRRETPRHEVELEAELEARLLVSVTTLPTEGDAAGAGQLQKLIGSTRNISETGLGVVIPSLRIGSRYITDENCTLLIVLDMYPAGLIEIEAVVVHHRRLSEDEKYKGHLVGLRITKMSDGDRDLYLGYLDILKYRALKKSLAAPAADSHVE